MAKHEIDFSQVLIGFDDDPIQFPASSGKGDEDMTLGRACTESLTALFQDEQAKLTGEDKVLRNLLARKVYKNQREPGGTKLALKAKDVVLLKDLVAKMFGPKIVGPAWELLEPNGADEAAAK